MNAPSDIAEVIVISSTVACGVGLVAQTFLRRWSADIERRLNAAEAWAGEANRASSEPVIRNYSRLVSAAEGALAAYRAIFAAGCWNERDRRAFAELEAALREGEP